MIFKYDQLRGFYRELTSLGRTELFRDWKGDNVFILRHDVDFDIRLAHRMAVIEQEENVVSTYFILTTCDSYNVLSPKNTVLLREIVSMGHEIGLHFDPTLYDVEHLEKAVDKEVDVLSFAVNAQVKSISLHNPSLHGQFPLFPGYVNAYDPSHFSDKNYISDSKYSFRDKDLFAFIRNVKKSMIQILLHPMHFSETGGGYDEVIVDGVLRYIEDLHRNFRINSTYGEHVGNDLLEVVKKRLT